jgi:hypothetical protein
MEVHHSHTHIPTSREKKWTHYFWEFLMLFLAVFCGFLAENQREHFIEHQREKQFIKTLVEDIRNDTSGLHEAIDKFSLINKHIDSLIPLLKDNLNIEKNAAMIYRHAVWLHDYHKVTYFARTIEQLKSSGNFRLIRNQDVSKNIMEYDGAMINNALDMQNSYVFQRKEKLLDLSNTVFNAGIIKNWFVNNYGSHETELTGSANFLTTEKSIIDRLVNELYQYALTITWFIGSLKDWILPKAIQLEYLIKKEYHLK